MPATATYNDGNTKALTSIATLASLDNSITTVSAAGLLTAVSAGTASITSIEVPYINADRHVPM